MAKSALFPCAQQPGDLPLPNCWHGVAKRAAILGEESGQCCGIDLVNGGGLFAQFFTCIPFGKETLMKRFWCAAAAALALTASTFTFAQTTAPAEAAPEDPNTGALTVSGGVDWTTAYFFRGYNQEDTGLIVQPYLTLTSALVSNDNFTSTATSRRGIASRAKRPATSAGPAHGTNPISMAGSISSLASSALERSTPSTTIPTAPSKRSRKSASKLVLTTRT